jgi:hypothetical protein
VRGKDASRIPNELKSNTMKKKRPNIRNIFIADAVCFGHNACHQLRNDGGLPLKGNILA